MNHVLPRPRRLITDPGGGHTATAGRHWRITAGPRAEPVARTLRELLAPLWGDRLLAARADPPPGTLRLHLDVDATFGPTDSPAGDSATASIGVDPHGGDRPVDESYEVTVDADGAHCRAATPEGVFRAAVTVAQLALTEGDSANGIPHQRLRDAPRHAWRGLLVDPARGFLATADLRRVVDLMALYKLNVLHLHLTDHQGWRLELATAPELTADTPAATGATTTATTLTAPHRTATIPTAAPRTAPRQPAPHRAVTALAGADSPDATVADTRIPPRDAAFYSAGEFRDLQAYAAARFVTVVPEIDLPGHCGALRRALPDLPPAPAPEGLAGRFPFVPPLDLADPATFRVVSGILREVCELTDGPFVHVGGDEAVGMTADSFEHAVRELRGLVRKFGKRPIAWQESSRAGGGPEESGIAQYWVDVPMMDLPDTEEELRERPDLLKAGFTPRIIAALKGFFAPADHDLRRILDGGGRVLLSPQSHLYLDRAYAADVVPAEQREHAARLGFPSYRPRTVEHAARWDPAAHGVPDHQLAGIEMALFGESVTGLDDFATLLLPRMPLLADTAWSGTPADWSDSRHRLPRHSAMWRALRLPYLATTEIAWDA
ncbi:family 20 glycosylhydrolase [Streptantibioticus parmotrematis]|uniref:family 20 glycosylhydrolase n=1 Tax=Streptantibioticus parmotrematis TaxID=2873249 RepID=UPI0033C34E02